jgi:hypothetical protein
LSTFAFIVRILLTTLPPGTKELARGATTLTIFLIFLTHLPNPTATSDHLCGSFAQAGPALCQRERRLIRFLGLDSFNVSPPPLALCPVVETVMELGDVGSHHPDSVLELLADIYPLPEPPDLKSSRSERKSDQSASHHRELHLRGSPCC